MTPTQDAAALADEIEATTDSRARDHLMGANTALIVAALRAPIQVEHQRQLERANRIIGWMMPYIGSMCPPPNGLFDLNEHFIENRVTEYGKETKGRPIKQERKP